MSDLTDHDIDLDQNATSPLDPEVLDAMRPHWLLGGNPESRHSRGRRARRSLEQARETSARILNAEPSELIFTSGGTEANNLAIFGLAFAERDSGPIEGAPRILAGPIEHPATAEPIARLEARGFVVDRPPVGGDGLIDPDLSAESFRPETRFAALILAHNETGAIQDVARLARLGRERSAPIPVHADAVQAVGRIAVDFRKLGAATLALSAHKFHGPAGIGALLVRKGTKLAPLLFGGGRDALRPGTPAVALAVGLAKALEIWERQAEARTIRWRSLRDRLERGLIEALGGLLVARHGPADESRRLPQTLHLGFRGIDGNALLIQLDLAGVSASLGSACASGANAPSPTLVAMRVPEDLLRGSVRFSLGAFTREAEIDEAVRRIAAAVRRIQNDSAEIAY